MITDHNSCQQRSADTIVFTAKLMSFKYVVFQILCLIFEGDISCLSFVTLKVSSNLQGHM